MGKIFYTCSRLPASDPLEESFPGHWIPSAGAIEYITPVNIAYDPGFTWQLKSAWLSDNGFVISPTTTTTYEFLGSSLSSSSSVSISSSSSSVNSSSSSSSVNSSSSSSVNSSSSSSSVSISSSSSSVISSSSSSSSSRSSSVSSSCLWVFYGSPAGGYWHSGGYSVSPVCNISNVGLIINLSNSSAIWLSGGKVSVNPDGTVYLFSNNGETYADPWANSGYITCECS